MWCWGANDSGQLGDGTLTSADTPVRVSDIVGATGLSQGLGSHTCALIDDGDAVRCWGTNEDHQLGDGTNRETRNSVAVDGLDGVTVVQVTTAGCAKLRALIGGERPVLGWRSIATRGESKASASLRVYRWAAVIPARSSAAGRISCWGSNERGPAWRRLHHQQRYAALVEERAAGARRLRGQRAHLRPQPGRSGGLLRAPTTADSSATTPSMMLLSSFCRRGRSPSSTRSRSPPEHATPCVSLSEERGGVSGPTMPGSSETGRTRTARLRFRRGITF